MSVINVKFDKVRPVKFGHYAAMMFEKETGRPLNSEENKKGVTPGIALVWAGLLHANPDLTMQDVCTILDETEDMDGAMQGVMTALGSSPLAQKKPEPEATEKAPAPTNTTTQMDEPIGPSA